MSEQNFVLTGRAWQRLEPHLPGKANDAGPTAKSNRLFLEAVFGGLGPARHGATFRPLPAIGTASSGAEPKPAYSIIFSTP